MAGGFCLLPTEVDKFKSKLIDGTINPEKLSKMTSEERHAFLKDIVGEGNARGVNSLFESKLLLKNQRQGMTTWAKKISGITPEVRRDLISRISRLDRVLSPAEEEHFLHDLAETKLGVAVTPTEAKTITNMSKKIEDARIATLGGKEKIAATKGGESALTTAHRAEALQKGFTPSAADMQHGYARYDIQKYLSDLKTGATSFRHNAADHTPLGLARGIVSLPKKLADISKALGASLDNSFALRQGIKTLFTHPAAWQREFRQSFVNLAKAAKNVEAAQREFKSRLMADPMYDQAIKDGLAINKPDDVFPTSLPGRIPGISRAFGNKKSVSLVSRAFNASEVAYDAYGENLRMGLYKQQMRQAAGKGLDTRGKFGKNVATMVNSLTGRGGLGAAEPLAGHLNVAFYSLRFLKSNVDTLLLHPLGIGTGGTGDLLFRKAEAQGVSYAQKQAAKNLVKIIVGTAGILATANALKPGSAELDPRSKNFGKIKIGDTRFDVSGGMASIVTLAAELASRSSKSSVTGQVTKINSGKFGAETGVDVFVNFILNKTSPLGGVGVDILKSKTHSGAPVSLKTEAGSLFTPLNIQNFNELKNDPNSANILTAILSDTLGIATNTYSVSPKDWSTSTSKEITQFKSKVSAQDFKTANNEYNQKVKAFETKASQDPRYKNMPQSQQQAILTAAENTIRAQVFKDHGFQYKQSKGSGKQNKDFINQLLSAPAPKQTASAQTANFKFQSNATTDPAHPGFTPFHAVGGTAPVQAPDPSLTPAKGINPSSLQQYQSGSGRDQQTWYEDPNGTRYIQQHGKLYQIKTRGVPLLKTQPRPPGAVNVEVA